MITGSTFSRSEMWSFHISTSIAFSSPAALAQLAVVGRVPGLADHRVALEALDHDAALVVHREVHRADHPVALALAVPALGGASSAPAASWSFSHSKKPHMPQRGAVELVVGVVDVGADASDDAAVAAGEEQLRLAVLEERIEAGAEEQPGARSAAGASIGAR